MIIHSKHFVSDLDPACIQPNAVDIRVSSIKRLNPRPAAITLMDGWKQFVELQPLPLRNSPLGDNLQDYWELIEHESFDVQTSHQVTIPDGMCGWVQIRSTLSRNGLVLSSGLYDSNFTGTIGFTLHNMTNNTYALVKDSRVAQFIMCKAETDHPYNGYYNQNRTS